MKTIKSHSAGAHHPTVVPFGPVKGVELVTMHCLERFRERAKVTGTAGEVLRRLEQWLEKARPAELKPGKALLKLLNHQCRAANYWLFGSTKKGVGFVLVAEGNKLVTVHRNESGEWRLHGEA